MSGHDQTTALDERQPIVCLLMGIVLEICRKQVLSPMARRGGAANFASLKINFLVKVESPLLHTRRGGGQNFWI